MYLEAILPAKADLLAQVASVPKFASMDGPLRMEAAAKTIQQLAIAHWRDELTVDLSDAVAMYEVINGKYPKDTLGDEGQRQRDEYESGLDDVVEEVFTPHTENLSANWLGLNTIDSRVWEDDGPRRLAESAAKELWKTHVTGKTNAQVLASAGVLMEDLIATPAQTQGTEPMADELTLDELLVKIKARIGDTYDPLAVYDDLEMIFNEDDDILVNSAADRVGLTAAEAVQLQVKGLEYGDPADDICKALADMKISKPATRAPRKAKDTAPATATPGALNPGVLDALKTCGVVETALAEALGVSRSTLVNYGKGKTAFVPEPEQHNVLRAEVVNRANMLLAALALIDSAEPMQVA